jgi:hypothetical protein
MAIDLDQVNELRNNGVYTVAHGPFDTSVMGYLRTPGSRSTTRRSQEAVDVRLARRPFSVVLEHTDDPRTA